MDPIKRRDGSDTTFIGRDEDQREIERATKSASFEKGGKPVTPQELIAIHGERDKVSGDGDGSSVVSRYANNDRQMQTEDGIQPEVGYGVDKVSALIEKAKEKLNKISNAESKDVFAEQQKMRYPKDEDTGRKHDEQASKDKYYPDYESGRDYLKKLKSNFMLKLRKISSLLERLSSIEDEIEVSAKKMDKDKDKMKDEKEKAKKEKEEKEKKEKDKMKKEKKAEIEGYLKVVGARIRRAISKISSVEEDLRQKKVTYPKEKDLGRDYDAKDTKDRYKSPDSNPLNKDLSKMWSLNKTIKTARDETMKVEIPDEKSIGGNDMEKLPLDKKEDVKMEAPKGKIGEDDEKKMISELKSVIESLNKSDEDFTEEIKKLEKAIAHMEEETGKKPIKKKEKEDEKDMDLGESGEIEKTPKPKPSLKDLGDEDIKQEKPFGKKSSLNRKAEIGEEVMEGDMSPETGNDWLDKYIQEQIVKSDKEVTVDMVKEQIQEVMGDLSNVPIMEAINKINEIVGTSPGVEGDGYGYTEEMDEFPEEGTYEMPENLEGITAIFTRKPTKQASYWEVKDKNNNTILKSSCSQIYGKKTFENWKWVSSEDYGKELCARIRQDGPTKVANLLKTEVNMTKHARDIEINAAKKKDKKKSTPKKVNESDYYSKAYGDKGYASKLTKKYTKASLDDTDNKVIDSFQKENLELKERLSQLETENERMAKKMTEKEKEIEKEKKEKEEAKKKSASDELDKKLRIRANKSIALANTMISKGFIKEEQKNEIIDDLMLMDDISFAIEEKLAKDKVSMIEATAENRKGNKLIRKGGLNNGINIISNNNDVSFKGKLEDLWRKPKV